MIKLGLSFNPLRFLSHTGPNVFIKRLSKSFENNKLFNVKSGILPNYDVGLFLVKKGKYDYNKPFFLRNGGMYIDIKNNIKHGNKINQDIFSSAEKSNGLIFNAEFCKKLFNSFYKLKNKVPSTVIFNGVPLDIFSPVGSNFRDNLGFSNRDKIIIVSASWRRHKRLEETIKLLEILNLEKKGNFKLIVLGKTHKKFKKNKNIIFAGQISPSSLPKWYRTADIYLHMSWIEPNANTLHEAIASGLPSLCCNNGGVGETIRICNAGIVSNVDPEYQFNLVDYYNPPEPNYSILKKDIFEIFENKEDLRKKINTYPIDINEIAKKYSYFINQNFKKK